MANLDDLLKANLTQQVPPQEDPLTIQQSAVNPNLSNLLSNDPNNRANILSNISARPTLTAMPFDSNINPNSPPADSGLWSESNVWNAPGKDASALDFLKTLGIQKPMDKASPEVATAPTEEASFKAEDMAPASRSVAAAPEESANVVQATEEAKKAPTEDQMRDAQLEADLKEPSAEDKKSPDIQAVKQSIEEPQKSKLESAMDEARQKQQMLNALMGFDQIGRAIAGGGYLDTTPKGYEELFKSAEQKVQDIKVLADEQRKAAEFKLKQDSSILENQLKGINIQKASMQVNDETARRNPNSEISKAARTTAANEFRKMGNNATANLLEKGNFSVAQVEDLYGQYNLSNMATNWQTQQTRLLTAKMHADTMMQSRQQHADQKMIDTDTKRMDAANKIVTAELQRANTPLGRSAGVVRSADALEQLVAQSGYKLTPQQVQEVVKGLDSMLAAGASTVSGQKELNPPSISKDIARLKQYITNHPQSAGQEAFVKNMMDTIGREKATAQKQITNAAAKLLSSYKDLAVKPHSADAWKAMTYTHGLPSPEEMFRGNTTPSAKPVTPTDNATPSAQVKVRRKSDGQVRTVDKNSADQILKDPNFEAVQ